MNIQCPRLLPEKNGVFHLLRLIACVQSRKMSIFAENYA